MNRSLVVPAADIAAAVLALALAALCWNLGVQNTDFPATGEVPAYTATRYVGPWLFLAMLLVAGAGTAVIDGVARVFRTPGRS
ncbi:hypothetical protein [Nocardia sp. NBC_01329]|uniref:hypothetical protein n=1 Tax=Nocardia sp. NBC_01329 TaxID=2903594 RepID=UPI002E0D4206|nr:hypothetical protein OG405_28315 [Nocardia sp. NBC_01329]